MLVAALALQAPFGIVFAWGTLVPVVRAQEHWPALLLGAVFSATPVGFGIGTTVGGRLADRLPPRRLCWLGLGLLAAGFTVAFAAPSGVTFVIAYSGVALGAGGGIALTGGVAALTRVMPERAGTTGGLASATYSASAIALGPVVAALAPHAGWLGALEIAGPAVALVAAALLLLMPPLPALPQAPHTHQGTLLNAPVLTGAMLALSGATFGAFALVNLPAQAAGAAGSAALTGAVAAMLAAGNTAGRLLAGMLADRFGVRPVVAGVLLLELATAPALFLGAGPATALAVAVPTGLAWGGDAGYLARLGRDAAPSRPNAAFGLVFAGFTCGGFSGPLLGALVGLPAAWLAVAAPAAGGLVLVAARARQARRESEVVSAGRAGGPDRAPGR